MDAVAVVPAANPIVEMAVRYHHDSMLKTMKDLAKLDVTIPRLDVPSAIWMPIRMGWDVHANADKPIISFGLIAFRLKPAKLLVG